MRFKVSRAACEPPPPPHLPKTGNAYKAEVRIGQSFTLGSDVVRCVSGDSHRAYRTEINVIR